MNPTASLVYSKEHLDWHTWKKMTQHRSELLEYSQVCQTPCVVSASGKIYSTRKLVPAPPLTAIPSFVLTLMDKLFPNVSPPVQLLDTVPAHAPTARELSVLRKYGLVHGTKKRTRHPWTPEEHHVYQRQWRETHRERLRLYQRTWHQLHKHARNARRRNHRKQQHT
jgi:hypothetical protein